jgi:glycosyltransferase involved in cell wall biosynthesis
VSVTRRHKILVDCERMKYPFTGLYYYCLYLARHLEAQNTDKEFCFYSRASTRELFNGSCVMEQHSLHKFLLPSTRGYSVWHSTYQGTMYFPWLRRIKVVFTIHDLNFLYDESKTEAKKKKYLRQMARKIRRADHVVAISNYVLNDIRQHFDLGNKPVSVIYNGLTLDEIADPSPPSLLPTAPFLFTVGTIVDKKNFHVLPGLLKHNNYQLFIAGITNSEEYKARILTEARALGVEDRVVFTGAVSESDKQWYLRNCLAFAFPSISEGFGLPVVEAMHFGKPVLLSRFTSLPEIGGEDAYYFDDYTPDALCALLDRSLRHFEQTGGAEKMRRRAQLFSWAESARRYHAVYNQVLGK